jgi:ketosteroid isomerase-like protein
MGRLEFGISAEGSRHELLSDERSTYHRGMRFELAAAAFLFAASPAPRPRTPVRHPDALLRVEQRWVEALARRDDAAVASILADDFLDSTYKGELRNRDEALAGLRSGARADASQQLSELRARVYGDAGVVTGINTVTARDGSFSVRVRFTDVFVLRGDRWLAVSAQETLVEGAH